MHDSILEINKRASKSGRVPIKIVLHKIHEDENETNKNGLHWKEEYVIKAKDSAVSMPICAEFADDSKEVPLSHGYTETIINEDGKKEPIFKNSETVGVIEKTSVERVDVNGENILALVGEGVLYKQRYPEFVKWVRNNFALNRVLTSIEIVGLEENDNKIIFEEENPTDEKRTGKEYQYSGVAILSVEPADDNAVVLEVAQNNNKNKEDNKEMEFNMNEIKSAVAETIKELNNKETVFTTKISELSSEIESIKKGLEEKDILIGDKDAKISELNVSIEDLEKIITELKEEKECYIAEKANLEKELVQANIEKKINEMNKALEVFSKKEKELCQAQIDACIASISACERKEELNSKDTEINSLVSKIYEEIGKAAKMEANKDTQVELNAKAKEGIVDIFSDVCSVNEETKEDTEINIF